MKKIIVVISVLVSTTICAQNKKTNKILNEGKKMFRLEKGSWYGTDHFLENFPEKRNSIGGYVSYETKENKINTIFFSRENPDEILVRYHFNTLPQPKPVAVDTLNHNATETEKDLISLYLNAGKTVNKNDDDFFSFYENTSFNFIPMINGNEKKVFILTGSQTGGFVIIGNDYLLTYNRKNILKKKSKIHNSILHFPYSSEDENIIESTFHSHVLSDYITSTDICTLLLYKDFIEWKQHIVISKKEVSIFNIENEQLVTMKRKDWDKIQ